MNSGGDGGTGIMQLTFDPLFSISDPRAKPIFPQFWDWRENIKKGVTIFKQKVDDPRLNGTGFFFDQNARNHPTNVKNSTGFRVIVDLTNQFRRSQNRPIFAEIRVPVFGQLMVFEPDGTRVLRDLLNEDSVRGYNGFIPSTVRNSAGEIEQFGLRWHEFRLRTELRSIPGIGARRILVVENERMENGRLVADAIWERIPVGSRPRSGDPNYVNNVRNRSITCP
jgi:hypothetical protein